MKADGKEIVMSRRHWKKICWMLALSFGLFELPAIVLATHGDDDDTPGTRLGLLFNIPGCEGLGSSAMGLEP